MSAHGAEEDKKKVGIILPGKVTPDMGLVVKPNVDDKEPVAKKLEADKKARTDDEVDEEFFDKENKGKLTFAQQYKQRLKKLREVFEKVFPKEEWECTERGHDLHYKNKKGQTVSIETRQNGEVVFHGEPIDKLIKAARKYEKAEQPNMVFEVEANTLEGAIRFMTALHQNHFDISKIKGLQLKDAQDYDLPKIIEEIKKQHTLYKAPKSPKPGKSDSKKED